MRVEKRRAAKRNREVALALQNRVTGKGEDRLVRYGVLKLIEIGTQCARSGSLKRGRDGIGDLPTVSHGSVQQSALPATNSGTQLAYSFVRGYGFAVELRCSLSLPRSPFVRTNPSLWELDERIGLLAPEIHSFGDELTHPTTRTNCVLHMPLKRQLGQRQPVAGLLSTPQRFIQL